MTKTTCLKTIILSALIILGIQVSESRAQSLGASLSELEGRPGEEVVVDLTLDGNTEAAQAGINIIYNPDVIKIEDLILDVSPGPVINENLHFIIKGVKSTEVQDPVNSEGLFFAVFPKSFPLNVISNGVIGTLIFTISDDAEPGDFSDIKFSFLNTVPANTTSFTSQGAKVLEFDEGDFIDGRVTVVAGSGGSGSCALANSGAKASGITGSLLVMFIPLGLILFRRLGS